jgi:hypothetical protein
MDYPDSVFHPGFHIKTNVERAFAVVVALALFSQLAWHASLVYDFLT